MGNYDLGTLEGAESHCLHFTGTHESTERAPWRALYHILAKESTLEENLPYFAEWKSTMEQGLATFFSQKSQ